MKNFAVNVKYLGFVSSLLEVCRYVCLCLLFFLMKLSKLQSEIWNSINHNHRNYRICFPVLFITAAQVS